MPPDTQPNTAPDSDQTAPTTSNGGAADSPPTYSAPASARSSDPVTLYQNIAHLLRRTGFGAMPDDIQAMCALGIDAVTNRVLNYDQIPDPIVDDPFLVNYIELFYDDRGYYRDKPLPVETVRNWWIYRMLATPRPLEEVMVLFWHNHWTSNDPDEGDLMLRQNRLFRKHALGNFREMAQEVSKDCEMVRYLNGDQNFKAHPNENYARELMELFTCGRVDANGNPNYTEYDVKAAARAFSGWNTQADYVFRFNPDQHDDGVKTFMGHTGDLNGNDIVDILVALPATAHYICRKLFRYFAYDDPEPEVLAGLMDIYFQSGYEIKPIVAAILTSDEFYSQKARNAIVKSPCQFVIGTIVMTGMAPTLAPPVDQGVDLSTPDNPDDSPSDGPDAAKLHYGRARDILHGLDFAAYAMHRMGQDLLAPPTVKGWDGGERWYNVNTMQARDRFAVDFANNPQLKVAARSGLDAPQTPVEIVPIDDHPDISNPPKLVDALLWQFGPLDVPDKVHDILVDVATQTDDPSARIRTTLALILSTGEYQAA